MCQPAALRISPEAGLPLRKPILRWKVAFRWHPITDHGPFPSLCLPVSLSLSLALFLSLARSLPTSLLSALGPVSASQDSSANSQGSRYAPGPRYRTAHVSLPRRHVRTHAPGTWPRLLAWMGVDIPPPCTQSRLVAYPMQAIPDRCGIMAGPVANQRRGLTYTLSPLPSILYPDQYRRRRTEAM